MLSSYRWCLMFAAVGMVAAGTVEFGTPATAVLAQDEPAAGQPAEKESAPEASPPAGDPLQKWTDLRARQREISRQLQELRVDFLTASKPGKEEIRQKAQSLLQEWQTQIEPEMIKLSVEILKSRPTDPTAGEFARDTQQYEEIAAITDAALKAGKSSGELVSLAGWAHFNSNQFERAKEILEKGAEEKQLTGEAERLVEPAQNYVDLWKAEQEIRAKEAAAPEDQQLPRVELETTKGKILLELFENEAPNTVANFISIVESGKYDGTLFHRVIRNFMAQGGDLSTREGYDPEKDALGYTIKCECYKEDARKHFRGSLSMALAGRDTGDSGFFITRTPTFWLNQTPRPESVHTVFGRVVEGMDAVDALDVGDKLISAKVIRKRDHEYKPVTSRDEQPAPSDADPEKTDPADDAAKDK